MCSTAHEADLEPCCARRRGGFLEDEAGMTWMWKWTTERGIARGRGEDHPYEG